MVNDRDDPEPIRLLREHGHEGLAASFDASYALTERQRDGVFGTARQIAGFLRSEQAAPWITRTPGDRRPEFSPAIFATSADTLCLLSREGEGSARAITASLTQAVFDAAERTAARSRHGRLATPLVAVLDEAANVVRLPDLLTNTATTARAGSS